MATKSKRAQLKDVKSGATLYEVMAFKPSNPRDVGRGCLSALRIASRPFQIANGSWWGLKVLEVRSSKLTKFSLKDCNVVPNTYNNHALFTTRKAAERYMADVIAGRYGYEEDKDTHLPYPWETECSDDIYRYDLSSGADWTGISVVRDDIVLAKVDA